MQLTKQKSRFAPNKMLISKCNTHRALTKNESEAKEVEEFW